MSHLYSNTPVNEHTQTINLNIKKKKTYYKQINQSMASSNNNSNSSKRGGGDEELKEMTEISKTLKEGERIVAPSRRPDGTLRKPIRIRAGYVPQDEVAIYQSKGALVC